jgi:hypothetical protein
LPHTDHGNVYHSASSLRKDDDEEEDEAADIYQTDLGEGEREGKRKGDMDGGHRKNKESVKHTPIYTMLHEMRMYNKTVA